jgi:hypothetical protein
MKAFTSDVIQTSESPENVFRRVVNTSVPLVVGSLHNQFLFTMGRASSQSEP